MVDSPLFLLGAGFNADAAAQVGPLNGTKRLGERIPIDARYPLVGNLWSICFDLTPPPECESIEERFATAIASKDHSRIRES